MGFDVENNLWLIEIFAGLITIFCGNWVLKKIIHNYKTDAKGWRAKLDQIVFAPLRLILWVMGIAYVFTVLSYHFGVVESAAFFGRARNAGIIFALAWMALRWKKIVQDQLLSQVSGSKYDPATLQTIFKLVTAIIGILALLVILQISGVNVMPLLAFGGIGAAAVGFAAKDVIANFFGGLMLFINRPFAEGDEICLCKDEIEGDVEKIGWYTTTVRDRDKCPVYLPNALFSKAFVVNRSRRSHRCIEETLSIRYEDAGRINELTNELKQLLTSLPEIDSTQSLLIGADSLGDYAVQVHLKVYTTTISETAFTRLRQEVLLQVNAFLERAGIEMPLPSQSIELLSRAVKEETLTLGVTAR